jgi:hypothetical protein
MSLKEIEERLCGDGWEGKSERRWYKREMKRKRKLKTEGRDGSLKEKRRLRWKRSEHLEIIIKKGKELKDLKKRMRWRERNIWRAIILLEERRRN